MPNVYDLSNRVALVTGGASGIGAASVQGLRDSGATVATFDLIAGVGADLALTGDIASSGDVEKAVSMVVTELGPIDILVNAAGIAGQSLPIDAVKDEEWDRVMTINATGSFYVCRAVVPRMLARGYGRIVLISSIAGKEGNPMAAAYAASKAAVIALTKSIGKQLAGSGVLVNCVAPAIIETPILQGLSNDDLEDIIAHVPMRRMGQPAEVANLICWLASGDCSFSTGATYDISGGRAVY